MSVQENSIRLSACRDGPPVTFFFSCPADMTFHTTDVETVEERVRQELRNLQEKEDEEGTFVHLINHVIPWEIKLLDKHGRAMEHGRTVRDYRLPEILRFKILGTSQILNQVNQSITHLPFHIAMGCPGDVVAVALHFPPILQYLPEDNKGAIESNLRDIFLRQGDGSIPHSHAKYLSPVEQQAVTENWRSLRFAVPEVQDNYDTIRIACRQEGNRALFYASLALKGNRDLVLETTRHSKHVLQYCDEALWKDLAIVASALCDPLTCEMKFAIITMLQQWSLQGVVKTRLRPRLLKCIVEWVGPLQVDRALLMQRLSWATSEQRMQFQTLLSSSDLVRD